jgi:mevalonate kinase
MDRVGRGRAKLLLFGEHSAVHGYPSIGLGLPGATEIRVRANADEGWSFPELSLGEGRRFGEFLASASLILPALASGGGEIRISSTIPRELGFGSSAALCVALAEAFAPEAGSPAEIWSIAHRAEAFFHGRPSGIDTGLSLLGGLRVFRPRPPELPETRLLPDAGLHLVIGAVPRRRSTAVLVGELSARIASGDSGARALVEELGAICERAIPLIEEAAGGRTGARLGTLLAEAHEALRGLGLGGAGVDRLIRAGLELGALGGKQSGAGAGGAFFLLYPSASSARASARELGELASREGIELSTPLSTLSSLHKITF